MPHILKNYDEELSHLKNCVVEMGTTSLAAVEKSFRALLNGDRDSCYEVIDADSVIDGLEKQIDEQGMAILLRFNPVATDLRHVLSSINICRSLERIGDHAVNIAKRSGKILKAGELDEVRLAEPLFAEARKIVSAALTAFTDVDETMARAVVAMDQRVDQIHKGLGKTLSAKISDQAGNTESLLNLIFIARSLERVGDLAVNIAEDVVFAISAADIRHSS